MDTTVRGSTFSSYNGRQLAGGIRGVLLIESRSPLSLSQAGHVPSWGRGMNHPGLELDDVIPTGPGLFPITEHGRMKAKTISINDGAAGRATGHSFM